MNFIRLKYGTAVLSAITLGIAVFYSWDRTQVKTEDLVELVEGCAERLLVTSAQTGTTNITITCGPMTNIFTLPLFNASTNVLITSTPIPVEDGTNLYRESDGYTNYVWRHYITNGAIVYSTNFFVTTGQYFRSSIPISYRGGRSMTWHTNVNGGTTNIEVNDHQIILTTNIANAIGIFNERSLLQWVDQSIYGMISKFVNHTRKSDGTYDAWFSTQSVYSTSLPMWTTNEIFVEAGVGRQYTNAYGAIQWGFTWPTNTLEEYPEREFCGPITVSNLWERFKILSLMQETYSAGITSNRYSVTDGEQWSVYSVEADGDLSTDDYLDDVLSGITMPDVYPKDGSTWYITDQDWGADRNEYLHGALYHVDNNPVSETNLLTYPVAYYRLRQLFSQSQSASLRYLTYSWMTPPYYELVWMSGLNVNRSDHSGGFTNGVLFRAANHNAQGISGTVSAYVRDGTATTPFNGTINAVPTNKCHKITEMSGIDGAAVANVELRASVAPIGALSLIRTNISSGSGTDVIYENWFGPYVTNAEVSVSILSGPIITKWDFIRCVP